MTATINQHLLDNISLVLKKSLSADATLVELRSQKKAAFQSVFKEDAGFSCCANTFQPYVQEVADEFLLWQNNQEQQLLIALVKKLERLLTVLSNFEHSHRL